MSISLNMNLSTMLSRLRLGEEGHAKIYLELEGANIYREVESGKIYLYNAYSCLWVKSQPFMVCSSISLTMARVINLLMDQLLRSSQFDSSEIAELKDWLNQTTQLSYCQRILSHIPTSSEPLLFDRHPDRLTYLPIKGCQNLDLLTGTVRPRKRDDLLFSIVQFCINRELICILWI